MADNKNKVRFVSLSDQDFFLHLERMLLQKICSIHDVDVPNYSQHCWKSVLWYVRPSAGHLPFCSSVCNFYTVTFGVGKVLDTAFRFGFICSFRKHFQVKESVMVQQLTTLTQWSVKYPRTRGFTCTSWYSKGVQWIRTNFYFRKNTQTYFKTLTTKLIKLVAGATSVDAMSLLSLTVMCIPVAVHFTVISRGTVCNNNKNNKW